MTQEAGIEKKTTFDFIRYASVWEDADILCEALGPVCDGGRILSIASSGDNALALLTVNPKEIIASDLSQAQLACVEIRMRAFQHLDYYALLAFLGVLESTHRLDTYQEFRSNLAPLAMEYWDNHPKAIEKGIIHAGKFERYLSTFGKYILPMIHAKTTRDELLMPRTHIDRVKFYDEYWDTALWRGLFYIFFSRTLMGWLGRDPSFFDHVQGDVSDKILSRTRHALTEIPTNTNPYLTYIIKGNYSLEALPRYLRPEFKETISSRVDRISLVCAPAHQVHKGKFDGFNLSDIFEYMDDNEFLSCYQALVDQANPGGRLAYWNMLVPRKVPLDLSQRVANLPELSEVLHYRDKAWFYQAFQIDEILQHKG